MSIQEHCPPATLKAGEQLAGFTVKRVTPVPEIRATVYEAIHQRTGAKFMHLHCADRENLYTITFRTPPPDSTGVAHILEHSVLAGSQNYPLKDVFNELVRGSLNTFINAFTAPDFTCYPICSELPADFYNLATVYTDLVLRPLLSRSTFMREGHHLEVGKDGSLSISGVVYNEMKGAFSTPERASQSTTCQELQPDTPYGVESGGLPECIPDLTYEAFCEFHHRFYSPSNARFFIYGNIPTRDHFEFLGKQLEGFDVVEVDSAVPSQPRWKSPREVAARFPIGLEDPEERRTTVNVAWLTAPAADVEERLILEVLQEALVGNPAAPLRKALIDSGFGEDLSPVTGLHTWFKELPFIVGLRGTDSDKAEQIEQTTLGVLEDLGRDGVSRDLLEAAIHQVEFKGLEIQRSPLPFPVDLLFRTLSTWLHDNDPLVPLTFPTRMAAVRKRWEKDPDLFRRAVGRWLVENPHRLRATITPSRTLADEQDSKLKRRLAELKASMSEADVARIRKDAEALVNEQQLKDSPQDLARIPRLRVEDIPREVATIPTEKSKIEGVPVLSHDIFSNSIAYLDVAFDVSDVPEELQPYLPLFGAAATGMGAAGMDYEAFATRKALLTGGVESELDAGERLQGDGTVQLLILRARALHRNTAAMVAVVRDILASADLSDQARLRDVLSEERNRLRAEVAPRGHMFSRRSAAAGMSLSAWRDEQWHGASQIRFVGELAKSFDEDPGQVVEKLAGLRDLLLRRGRMSINVTGDADCLAALRGPIAEMVAALPEGGAVTAPIQPQMASMNPGIAIPGEVCYVSRVLPVPRHNEKMAPHLHVVATHLGTGLLYKKIRVEGGAYGGFGVYSPFSGQFAMISYRDPNLQKTIGVYDSVIDAFLEEDLGPDGLRSMIVGAMGRLDRPMDPAEKGRVAMQRIMLGLTDEDRQRFREGVLSTTVDAMRTCARDVLREALPQAPQAVYGPRGRIEEANKHLTRPFTIQGLD